MDFKQRFAGKMGQISKFGAIDEMVQSSHKPIEKMSLSTQSSLKPIDKMSFQTQSTRRNE